MRDRILEAFLTRQREEGLALAAASDLVELHPIDPPPTPRYHVRFHCLGLIRTERAGIAVADRFELGIYLAPDYLRRCDPFQVLTFLGPRQTFHPNISDRAPLICVGPVAPGTPLVELLYRAFEVITYKRMTPDERNALNPAACAWSRRNQYRFPIDPRPLKRRAGRFRAEVRTAGEPRP